MRQDDVLIRHRVGPDADRWSARHRERMEHELEIKPRAVKDMRALPEVERRRLMDRIERLCEDGSGDVKHLTDFTPECRLRVGDYRVLFQIEADVVVVYRVVHRRDAYR